MRNSDYGRKLDVSQNKHVPAIIIDDCQEIVKDCQPIVNHTLRIVNIRRLFFAFFVSNPTIFRVPVFKSVHFARGAA